MSDKEAKNVISSYRKKQKRGPYIIGGIAILLAIAGIVLLIIYLAGGGGGCRGYHCHRAYCSLYHEKDYSDKITERITRHR